MNEREELLDLINKSPENAISNILRFSKHINMMNNQNIQKQPPPFPPRQPPEFVDNGIVPTPQKQNIVQKAITKALRVLSCHGDDTFTPCPYREKSVNYPNSSFCGACGCGDKAFTQLVNIVDENGETTYSKLDFPQIQCPLKMPGFMNYGETELDSEENKNSRKIYLENSRGIGYIKEHSYIKVEKNNENSRTESEQRNDESNPNTENQQSND